MVTADVGELGRFFHCDSILDIKKRFEGMEVSDVPDSLSVPSLSAGYVRTGDYLYTPMGSLTLCKTITGDSLGLRPGISRSRLLRVSSLVAVLSNGLKCMLADVSAAGSPLPCSTRMACARCGPSLPDRPNIP